MTPEEYKYHVQQLTDKLFRYAMSIIYQRELAEDVIQEVFVKLWLARKRPPIIRNVEAWCVRCTRNLLYDKLKAKKLKVLPLDELPLVHSRQRPDLQAEGSDLMDVIKAGLRDLPQLQREIFQLRELAGFSNAEIGKILDLDANKVKVYLHRARSNMKNKLKKIYNYGLHP